MRYFILSEMMKEAGVSVEELAKTLGCHRNSIYNKMYAVGNSDFSVSQAILIRDKFFPGCSIDTLFRKEGYLLAGRQPSSKTTLCE